MANYALLMFFSLIWLIMFYMCCFACMADCVFQVLHRLSGLLFCCIVPSKWQLNLSCTNSDLICMNKQMLVFTFLLGLV